MTNKIIVFTDGSCKNNGHKNAIGGIGIHFPNGELADLNKRFKKGLCTNQRTELYAILLSIRYIDKFIGIGSNKIIIYTDSKYCINCFTKWVNVWKEKKWKTGNGSNVKNRDFIEPIHNYYEQYDIKFKYIRAHTGKDDKNSVANDHVDKLAKRATKRAMKMLRK